jgi:transposase-like protein
VHFGLAPKERTRRGFRVEEAVMKEIKRRQHHSGPYRQRGVELLLTGKAVTELAGELGVPQSTLDGWKRKYLLDRAERPVDVEGMSQAMASS